MGLFSNAEKADLRRAFLQERQALAIATWEHKSLQLCQHLQTAPIFTTAQTVLAYFSVRQEPDLAPLFGLDKTWGFPRCVGQDLTWHQWSADSAWPRQQNRYGIWEPHPAAPPIAAAQVDLILVPAIACDFRGYRLGYGGGFYDRLLSASPWQSQYTVGIIFETARVPELPKDAWDQRLNAVCTENGFFFTQDC